MINEQHLTGIGKLHFLRANQLVFNNEFAGLSLMYVATYGEEDKKRMLNPQDDENFTENFNEMFNK